MYMIRTKKTKELLEKTLAHSSSQSWLLFWDNYPSSRGVTQAHRDNHECVEVDIEVRNVVGA